MLILHIDSIEHGWLDGVITVDSAKLDLTASYLSDAPTDLIQATTALLVGETTARCSWSEEPGEYRWLFIRRANRLSFRILWLSSESPMLPDEAGELKLEAECALLDFARAVHLAMREVLDRYGLDDYHRRWVEYPFPLLEHQRLAALLGGGSVPDSHAG